MPKHVDLSGNIYNNWKVLRFLGDNKYQCECLLCNRKFPVYGTALKDGSSKSCVECAKELNRIRIEEEREKLEGTVVGNWEVIEYLGGSKYKCKCMLCGKNYRTLNAYDLKNNIRECCDSCINKLKSERMREHLEGTRFGKLVVQEYLGNSYYKCLCDCTNTEDVHVYRLRTGEVTACKECMKKEHKIKYRNTIIERYGDISSQKIGNAREDWQRETLDSKEALSTYVDSLEKELGHRPTSNEVATRLSISIHILLTYTRAYKINLYTGPVSNGERQIREMLKGIEGIRYNDRTVLHPKELDIYIPDKHLAFEFNGTYWHSYPLKNRDYHKDKTIICARQNVRLVHIFEYEWEDEVRRDKVKKFIEKLTGITSTKKIYARNTEIIDNVSIEECIEFENKYHLQGSASSSIRIGLKYKDELVGLMTFGKPRFNSDCQYELIRLCYKDDISIVGGAEKMFKHFTRKYNPDSVLSYCDMPKFTGNVYNRLGFKVDKLTDPNYVWVDTIHNEVLPRYKTQKQKLIEMGIGSEEETEDEIMENLGFYKVYDCGNMRFKWKKENSNEN